MNTLRIFDLQPGKRYKTIGWTGQLGTMTYSVRTPVKESRNVYKLYFVFVGTEELKAATRYTRFVEVP